MKKFFIFSFVSIFISNITFAKIWRINNVAGVTADFTTAQLAHDNILVLAGDTLHIEPSTVNYGSLTMTKRLTIISIGDFFAANPTVQYAPLSGRLTTININNINANGSVLHCNLTGSLNLNGVSNIRIERCHIESTTTFTNASSITVLNNFLYGLTISTSSSSIVVSNNIIEYFIDMAATASAIISNNILKAVNAGGLATQIYNSTFQNNIINKTGLTLTFSASIVQNNLSSNATLPVGNGNINNVVMTNVFVNPVGLDDNSFMLQTAVANPAAGAGIGGIDCGAFGGTTPFKPGLQAAVPAIYKINAPITPSGNTMNVTFSTRSNN
ncbi:MAG TPA: hypothetical protein VLR49_00710 [Ferruginibacter sp.]|nr:hypothetical protein [Ferruginibacter sp.]